MNNFIAVIDDEEDISELVSVNLKKNGFSVREYNDSRSFLRSLKNQTPELIILDLMLPDIDGLELCKQLKKNVKYAGIPIIMLTAKVDESDKIVGLELGADDYITKPFSPRELVARVKAVLRRFETGKDLKNGPLRINHEKFEVTVNGENIPLTATEFKILSFLYSKKGKVYSREELMNNVWDENKIILDRTIDVHVKNLREKLGKAGSLIKNIRGVGYKLSE